MNFINSFLLWSAAGAALPVLIHMLNREKPKKVNIPTVEFIIKAVKKSSGSRKLNNFLLLLLRMLILLCLSLIVARPQIEKFLSSKNESKVQAVIIIDNSYYTAHKSNSSLQIDDIKKKARDIVQSLPSGSLISIMTAEENDNDFTEIQAYINDKIDQLSPAPLNADLRSLVTAADEMLKDLDENARKRIYIISDMNRGAWDSNYEFTGIPPESIYLETVPQRVGNVFISNVTVKSTGFSKSKRIFQRRDTEIQVKIAGDRVLSGLKVKLIIEGQEVDEKVIFTDDKESMINFSTSFDKEGMYFCEVKVETQDSIEIDNVYYFNIKVLPPLNIYLANDRKSINPLIYRAALSPSGWHGKQKFNVDLLSYKRLLTKIEESKPDLIMLTGSLDLSETQWSIIQNYIRNGSVCIICPDQFTQFTSLNQAAFPMLKSKIIPVDNDVKLTSSANEDWKTAVDIPPLYDVKIKHYFTLEQDPISDDVKIPLRFNDGKTCLSIHKYEQGKLAFWGLSSELEFSDFLNNDSFPLLWHSLIEKITDPDLIQQNLYCGLPIDIYANNSELDKYQVLSPAGTTDQIPRDNFEEISPNLFRGEYKQTYIPGHYKSTSSIFQGFSCNLERHPDYFKFPEQSEFESLRTEKTEDQKEDLVKSMFGPDGLLIILIVLALIFMMLEIHIGNKNYYAGN